MSQEGQKGRLKRCTEKISCEKGILKKKTLFVSDWRICIFLEFFIIFAFEGSPEGVSNSFRLTGVSDYLTGKLMTTLPFARAKIARMNSSQNRFFSHETLGFGHFKTRLRASDNH